MVISLLQILEQCDLSDFDICFVQIGFSPLRIVREKINDRFTMKLTFFHARTFVRNYQVRAKKKKKKDYEIKTTSENCHFYSH